jgi:hypothetical protein
MSLLGASAELAGPCATSRARHSMFAFFTEATVGVGQTAQPKP